MTKTKNKIPLPTFVAPPIQIYVGSTFIKLRAERNGNIGNGINLSDFTKRYLQEKEWVPRFNSYVVNYQYSYYDTETGMVSLPRHSLNELLPYLEDTEYELIHLDPVIPKPIKMNLKKKFPPREEQIPIIDFMTEDKPYSPVSAFTGIGKAQALDDLVKVPGGWRTVGSLREGDIVTAWDGKPTEVLGVYPQGLKSVTRITFNDGRFSEPASDHNWSVLDENNDMAVMTSTELLEEMNAGNKSLYVPHPKSETIDDALLPIPPYLLGVLLCAGKLTNGVFLQASSWIAMQISSILPESMVVKVRMSNLIEDRLMIALSAEKTDSVNELKETLSNMGLLDTQIKDRFIPPEFLYASHEQRIDLIRGMLDSVGSSINKLYEFRIDSENIALGFQYLIRSIGGECKLKKVQVRKRDNDITHYVCKFYHYDMQNLFTVPERKQKMASKSSHLAYNKLGIASVVALPMKKEMACIHVDHPDGLYITNDFIVTHNTFCAEATICKLKVTTLIVLSGLIDQWYKSLRLHTDISSGDIYVVQGNDSLKKLWEAHKHGYRPKVIIFSSRTLLLYAINPKLPYSEFPSYAHFQEAFGIGLKIMDEVHLGFHTNTQIDMVSNIKHNVYLSATYQRNQPQGKRIFNMVFPTDLRFGEQLSRKYTTVYMNKYRLGISPDHISKFKTLKGYNHAMYEKFLVKRPHFFNEFIESVLLPLINMYYHNKRRDGHRLLILCQTKLFVLALHNVLKKRYTDVDVEVYFSGDKTKFGKDTNLEKDIIISTHKSCGTGRDIKQLKTCINTVSFASEPLASQVMGRLRHIPGEETIYVDIWNGEVPSHYHHYKNRVEVYRTKALKLYDSNL